MNKKQKEFTEIVIIEERGAAFLQRLTIRATIASGDDVARNVDTFATYPARDNSGDTDSRLENPRVISSRTTETPAPMIGEPWPDEDEEMPYEG